MSTGNGLHHVGVGCKASMIFNMPRNANDEGHITGWLNLAFAMQRQPAILRAQPHAPRTSPVDYRLQRRASHEEVDASAARAVSTCKRVVLVGPHACGAQTPSLPGHVGEATSVGRVAVCRLRVGEKFESSFQNPQNFVKRLVQARCVSSSVMIV